MQLCQGVGIAIVLEKTTSNPMVPSADAFLCVEGVELDALCGSLVHALRKGQLRGTTTVSCLERRRRQTTTPNDINLGIVNILVGFAPLKPAEFVVIKIQQMAGQVQA